VGETRLVRGRVDFSDRFVKPNYSAELTELDGRLGRFSTEARDLPALEITGRAAGTAEERRVSMLGTGREALRSASLLRHERSSLFLVRLAFLGADSGEAAMPESRARLADFVESTPDAFVLTAADGRIIGELAGEGRTRFTHRKKRNLFKRAGKRLAIGLAGKAARTVFVIRTCCYPTISKVITHRFATVGANNVYAILIC
jgi:hypothetical protein